MYRAQSGSINHPVPKPRHLRGLFFEAVRNITVLQKIGDYSKATTVPRINRIKIKKLGTRKREKVSLCSDNENPRKRQASTDQGLFLSPEPDRIACPQVRSLHEPPGAIVLPPVALRSIALH
jgi:hypothetical protein